MVLAQLGTGGVERVACVLARGAAEHDLRAGLAVASAAGPARALVPPEVPVHELVGGPFAGRLRALRLFFAIPALVTFIRARRPRILLSSGNHTHVATAFAHALAWRRETALVVKITNPLLPERASSASAFFRTAFYRWLFARAAAILVLSEGGRAQALAMGAHAHLKIVRVHNPYVSARPSAETAPEAAREDVPVVLSVGRLTAQKNHALLLDAMARLVDRPWRLVILGEGPLRAEIEARAQALGIASRVELRGFVPDPTPYFRAARALALTSTFEDLPAVLLEAMSHGCAVVTTRSSQGVVDLVEEAGVGVLVPSEAGAIAGAIARELDDATRRAVPALVARYAIDHAVAEHAAVFERLIASQRALAHAAPLAPYTAPPAPR